MGILQLMDELPDAVTRSPAQLWSVLAAVSASKERVAGRGWPGAGR